MKFSKWILGAAFLFSAQIATVQGASCDPCDPCYESKSCDLCDIDFCDVEYDFYIDALYWKFCRTGLEFEEDDDTSHVGHDWHWGFRLGAIAHYESWDLGLRYTSFCPDAKHHGVKHKFDYKVLDIEVGRTCCLPCDGLSIRPVVGAKLAWIDDTLDRHDSDDGDKIKLDYDGYGLYLGAAARWELCSYSMCDRDIPLALVTRATTGILHSKFCYSIDFDSESDHDIDDECVYVPVHDLYVGLEMSFCDLCGCGDAFFQIGYEVQQWGSWRDGFADAGSGSEWGTGGLVLRFGASF